MTLPVTVEVNRVDVRARMRYNKPKPTSPNIKSVWSATTLLTVDSVYHTVTTPECRSSVIKEESRINELGVRPRTLIKDSFIHLTSSRNIRVLYFYVIIEKSCFFTF